MDSWAAAFVTLMFLLLFNLLLHIITFLMFHIYLALVLVTISKKTKTRNEWLAWLPIGNMYLMTKIAKVPWWTVPVAFFALIINMLIIASPFIRVLPEYLNNYFVVFGCGIVLFGIAVLWWWRIAEARGKPGWLALVFLLLPVTQFLTGLVIPMGSVSITTIFLMFGFTYLISLLVLCIVLGIIAWRD